MKMMLSVALVVAVVGCGDEAQVLTPGPIEDSGAEAGEDALEDVGGPDADAGGATDVVADAKPEVADAAACASGPKFCNGKTLYTCKPDGSGYVETSCPTGCENGACKPLQGLCKPSETFCEPSGKHVVKCAADGQSAANVAECKYGCDEAKADCKPPACQPGDKRCAADAPLVVEACLEDQTGWKKSGEPCTEKCENGKCIVSACKPGETQCGADGIMACNEGGTDFELKTPCKVACLTGADGKAACAKCKAGDVQCDGSLAEACNDPLVGFVTTDKCTDIEACSAGKCVATVVLDGSKEDSYLLLTKAFVKCWTAAKDGSCSAIDASGIDYAITSDEISKWFCDNKDALKATLGADYDAALDIMGCGLTNVVDMSFKAGITAGLNGKECIGYSSAWTIYNSKEIVVDTCDKL